MYGKIFDSMYDGTLADDWRALITFQQLIVLCDCDGTIDMTPSAISRRTGIPIEHIKAGIEILENPDPYSRTADEEGRRIQRIDDHKPWGWFIVNHNKYRNLQDKDTVREQNRLRKQKQRAKEKKSQPVTHGHAPSRHTDADTDTNKRIKDLFSYWQETHKHPKSKLDTKRKTVLKNALNDYGFDDCKKSIKGLAYSSFHMGDNETKTVYDSLSVIFKNADNVEKFISYVDNPPAQKKTKSNKSAIKLEILKCIERGSHSFKENGFNWSSDDARQVFERMRQEAGGAPWNGSEFIVNQAINNAI